MNKRWCILLLTLGLILALTGGAAMAEGEQLVPAVVEAPESVIRGEDFTITITEPSPNAANYQLIIAYEYSSENRADWQFVEDLDDTRYNETPSTMTVSTETLLPGEYLWWCGAWNQGEEELGGTATGIFTVTLPEPVVLSVPDTVERGEYFTVTAEEVPYAEFYGLNIIDTHGSDNMEDWEWLQQPYVEHEGPTEELTVSTAILEPGDYRWWYGVWTEGKAEYGNKATGMFTVAEPSSPVNIHVSTNHVNTVETFSGNIVAPGAEGVRYYVNGEEHDSRDGEVFDADWLCYNYHGDYVLGASACFNGVWTNWEDCTVTVYVDAPNGSLPEPNGWIMMAVSKPDDVIVHFDGNENARSYSYWHRLEDGGDDLGWDGFDVDENTEFPVELHLSTANLVPGNLYRVMMDINAQGYDEGHKERLFIVNGNPDPNITLDVPDSLQFNQSFDVHVNAPGAEMVIINCSADGNHRMTDNYNENEGYMESYVSDTVSPEEGGTIYVWAAAYYNGTWNHVTECKAISVSPASSDQVDSPSLSLDKTTVTRGDFVKATIGEVSQAAYTYRLWFWDENGQWRGDYGRDNAGDVYIPTGDLEAGTYTVHAYVRVEDHLNGEGEQDLTFTVTDPEGYGGGLYVKNTELLTNENMEWSIYAKYADHIALCVTDDPDAVNRPEENWWHDNDGDWGHADLHSFDRPGTYYAYVGAHFDGENGGHWDYVGTPVEIHVTANQYFDSEFMRSLVPATVNSGEDLVINLPDGVTGNWANVYDDADGTHIYWMNWDEGRQSDYNYFDTENPVAWAAGGEGPEEPCFHGEDGNIFVPAQYLKPNHTYHIDMDMWGSGVGTAHDGVNGVKFSVVEPSQNEIALTINDSLDDQTMQVNEEWTVRVSAPGATAIRFFDGWGWHPRWVDENGVWEDGWSDGADGTKPRYAQACYDPIDQDTFDDNWDSLNWQGVSNVIRLTFTANGQLEAATFTLDNAVVSRGDFAVLRLNGMVDGAQYHANAYWRDEDGNENWMGDRWYEHENGVIMLPTIDMGPGEWIIRLDSYGLVGLFGSNWESTVTITESSSASLNFSKYDVQTNERFWNAIRVPGAVEITTTVNEPDGWQIGDWDNVWQFGPWDGEVTQGDALWFDHSGTYTVKLYARMSENGGWEYTGASKTITVTAPHYYSSEYLRSLVPAVLNSGEDLVINLPEGVTGDWANVWDDADGNHIYWMNWDENRQSNYNYFDTDNPNAWAAGGEGPEDPCFHGEGGNIYIPAQYLKPNHTYHLDMDMWGGVGTAHDDGVYDVKFIVVPGTDGNVKLRVNDMDISGDLSFDVNEWYTVKATASGADEIRVFDGYNWHYAGGDTFEEDWRNGGNETRRLYAQARYNGGDWSGISNIITVSSYSDLWNPVDFSIVNENATVAKGDELVLRVAVDLEAEYNAHVKWMDENNNEQWIDGNYGLDGDTIRVSTDDLWEGDFYVRLDVFGKVGSCDNCLDLPFTVTRGSAYFRVDKTDVEVLEDIHVSVYDPDAEKIRFSNGYGWWYEDGWDGDTWFDNVNWVDSPDDVTIVAEGWHGSEWVEIGREDIRITAPNGQLDEPAIEGSTSQLIEDGLNFWIGMPDGASYYYVEVWEATDDYDNRVWKFNSENMESSEGFHIDGSELQVGTAYTVYVNARGYGYESHGTQRDITMVAERQPVPEFTVSSNTVTHGEFIHMHISNFDPDTNYHAYFRGGYIEDLLGVWTKYNGAEIIISSADLLQPGEYRLCLDVYDKPGYGDNGWEMNITVNDNGGMVFSLTDDHVEVSTDLPVYALAQGADQIHVVLEKDGQITDEWYEDGNAYIWSVSSWGVGTFTAKAYARFGNDWTLIDSHTLEITSQGQSVAPELTVASQILNPGEMPTITFGEGDNVGWYKLIIWGDDGWVLNRDIEEGPGTHTVQESWFEEGKTLEAGKSYTMNISVWNGGYEPGWSNDVPIAVIDSSCSELTLNVPAALTEIEEEAFAGTPAKIVRINANPGLHISSRAFADSSIIVAVIPDGVNVDPNAFEGCGPVVIVPSLD